MNRTGFCAICGVGTQGTDLHHVTYRSAGGSDDPSNLIEIDRRCHEAIHRGDWHIAVTPEATYVLDTAGTVLSTRWNQPDGFDQGAFVASLDAGSDDLSARSAWFRFLDDDGLIAAGQALYRLHYTGWLVRARLFETALHRTPYGTKSKKLRELASLFNVGGHQAYREAAALEVYEANREVVTHASQVPSPDMLLMALGQAPKGEQGKRKPEHPAVGEALELLVDRRAVNPAYTREDYRADLAAGRDSMDAPPAYCECVCPNCGALAKHRRP